MRISDLKEARRNAYHPAQQRLGVADMILKYKDDPNIFISFTDLPKIGINPMTSFNTPAGIYAYPLSMFVDAIVPEMKYNAFVKIFPFASSRKFIFVIRPTVPVTTVENYTYADLTKDIQKFIQVTSKPTKDVDELVKK